MKKVELLAPAGDLARAKTAVRYGADAVYIGGQLFSLRSRASNFTMDDIREACLFAKDYGCAIHVTVNMIPHEEDFEGLEEYLRQLEAFGVKAIIVASPAVMKLARRTAPSLEIHCSTQMSVTNSRAAEFMHEAFDVDRVVLARECTMEEVKKITAASPVETEAFIHGGMCVNYSGRCTLSNRMTLRDANRGGCAQSCRWQYHLYENEREISDSLLFTAGSKDLMGSYQIYDLMKAGVSSLKIEGRMKTEYYIASVVSAYRHLIDEIMAADGPLCEERMAWHTKEILRGENRETCAGFYNGRAAEDSLIYHPNSDANVNHDFLATVKSFDRNTGTAVIETRNPIDTGMEIEVLSPGMNNRVFTLSRMKNEDGEFMEQSRRPMALLKVPVPFEVREEDILRRNR
ncbi:MAG: U32 family peptidase [Erysipelotrichaceae bacterium]|nr:U32 family peptidase [Erysipelotrichaceae bacterium]